ncbi:beta-crystallin B2-like [Argopecten irradians]|uniref:beta-crystallin B2-like n=1 Tax=Argopecten irradians TaxID=31199 RepID=UPI00371B4B40
MSAPSAVTPLITIYDKRDCEGALKDVSGPIYDLTISGFRKFLPLRLLVGYGCFSRSATLVEIFMWFGKGQTVNLPEFCTAYLKPIEVDFTEKPEMTVYTGPSFTGQQKTFNKADADLVGTNFQDTITSVVVESGAWIAYRDINYQRPQYLFTRGSFNGTSSEGHFQNNAISSLKPIAHSCPC